MMRRRWIDRFIAIFMAVILLYLMLCIPRVIADSYPACEADFAPTPETCQKFAFVSQANGLPNRVCMIPDAGESTFYDLDDLPPVNAIDPMVATMSSLVTNVFEGGDKSFGYGSCKDIGDMRGYTCGYVGFTTGTDDAEMIVKAYSAIKPDNALAQFLPRLSELSQLDVCSLSERGSTLGLESFCDAWLQEACQDPSFAALQRSWVQDTYMIPSARFAAAAGVTSPLGQLIFYDTIIQHGYQSFEQDINILRLLELTGTRGQEESEQSYLTRFLTTRRQMQCCYPDNVWPASATRSADLQSLVDQFEIHKDLNNPLPLPFFKQIVNGDEDDFIDRQRCAPQ